MSDELEDYVEEARGCVFCAGFHDLVEGLLDYYQPCPRIKRIVRTPSGEILELEFWPNGDWEDRVVFPSDEQDEGLEDGIPT